MTNNQAPLIKQETITKLQTMTNDKALMPKTSLNESQRAGIYSEKALPVRLGESAGEDTTFVSPSLTCTPVRFQYLA
jgi:hypothetical protein